MSSEANEFMRHNHRVCDILDFEFYSTNAETIRAFELNIGFKFAPQKIFELTSWTLEGTHRAQTALRGAVSKFMKTKANGEQ